MLVMLLLLLVAILLGGYATQYVINIWGPILNHKKTHMSFVSATLVGLFVSSVTIPVAIVTWVIKKLAN